MNCTLSCILYNVFSAQLHKILVQEKTILNAKIKLNIMFIAN